MSLEKEQKRSTIFNRKKKKKNATMSTENYNKKKTRWSMCGERKFHGV